MEPIQGEDERVPRDGGAAFVRIGLYFYGAMLAVALIWRVGGYGESILYLDDAGAARGVRWLPDLALGVAVALAIIALSNFVTRVTGWGDKLARALAERIGDLGVANAVLLALASGLGEEFLFRGALQPRVGVFWAGVLFGCVHFVPRREFLPWTGFAVLAGWVFGALYVATGNLVAPVTAHVLVNAINLPLLVRQYREAVESRPRESG